MTLIAIEQPPDPILSLYSIIYKFYSIWIYEFHTEVNPSNWKKKSS